MSWGLRSGMSTHVEPRVSIVREGISVEEYASRRNRVLRALNGSAAVVLAGEGGGHDQFVCDSHFTYLTGIRTEAGAAVLFNPAAEDPRRRVALFLRPIDPELDRWERYRDMISADLRASTGFASIFRLGALGGQLAGAARRSKKLACLHPCASHTAGVSPDLALYRKVQERVVGVSVEDRTMLLNEMRAVKSDEELRLMRLAAEATVAGYRQVLRHLRPGGTEAGVARTLESMYLDRGSEGSAYPAICGTGLNATLLHYRENAATCRAGELILIDSGARYQGYACDVTRTFPVSGRFTEEHREVYGVVLKAFNAALRATRPGAFMWQVDKAARDVIDRAGYGDAFMHSIGHQLGLDVHDATPDGPLKAGMVITIEPGIYLPDRRMGIRIEDSVVVTKTGARNLTAAIPKSIEDIERAMSGVRAKAAR